VVFFADELGSNGTRSDAALHELGEWLAAAFGPAIELRRPAVEIQGD
jgi:hypothetical protein